MSEFIMNLSIQGNTPFILHFGQIESMIQLLCDPLFYEEMISIHFEFYKIFQQAGTLI